MTVLNGRVAIVTGAAQGIGAEFALGLAREGARIVIADRDSGAKTVAAIVAAGGQAIDVPTDVSSEAATQAMVAKTVAAFGRVDILVNNAAIFTAVERKPFTEISVAEWDLVQAVNVKGMWLCCKAAVPEMRKNKYGKIINISSGRFFKGIPFFLHYDASKGAAIGITRSLAREVGGDNICVNAIAPGSTMSENVKKRTNWIGSSPDDSLAGRALKRLQDPKDLMGACLFLASPSSDFMTGQTIVVDGGQSMW